jgi:hypothetical protein
VGGFEDDFWFDANLLADAEVHVSQWSDVGQPWAGQDELTYASASRWPELNQ